MSLTSVVEEDTSIKDENISIKANSTINLTTNTEDNIKVISEAITKINIENTSTSKSEDEYVNEKIAKLKTINRKLNELKYEVLKHDAFNSNDPTLSSFDGQVGCTKRLCKAYDRCDTCIKCYAIIKHIDDERKKIKEKIFSIAKKHFEDKIHKIIDLIHFD